MNEKVAHWATAVSAAAAAIALSISLIKYWADSNERKIQEWQKVVVYELILNSKAITFDALKNSYISSAQQIQTLAIPTDEIQDRALRKVLLELQADNLILYTEKDDYRPNAFVFKPSPEEMMAMLKEMEKRKGLFPIVQSRILEILDKECGNITEDKLYRIISKSIDIDFPLFKNMLTAMRGLEVHKLDDGTWCTTYDSEKHNKAINTDS